MPGEDRVGCDLNFTLVVVGYVTILSGLDKDFAVIYTIADAVAEALEEHRDLNQTLDAIGAFAAGGVQTYMTELKNPPNSAYTIEQKGSSNPLIDTGTLRASITWKIENKKPEEGI